MLNVREALFRARRMTKVKSKYKLGAGGRNPKAETPFTTRDGVYGSDCSGFVRWAWQIDRYQPKWFPLYDGWINCDSLILATFDGGGQFKHVNAFEARPGDAVVFPSIWVKGVRKRVGHEGIIVEVPLEAPTREEWEQVYSNADRAAYLKGIKVIDCNASSLRRLKGHAIGETTAYALWNKPDAVYVRFLGVPE